jgi:hypothetical protein
MASNRFVVNGNNLNWNVYIWGDTMKLYNLDDALIARKVNKLHKDSYDFLANWREEAEECFNFAASNQWDEKDIMKMEDEERPVVTYNFVNAVISIVLGMEANQRKETTFTPRHNDDSQIDDAIKQVVDWVRDYGEIETEEASVFEDMLVSGMGWSDTSMDYETDLDGKVIQESVSPFEMTYDTRAVKRNITDARWVCHGKKYSMDEILDLWPDADVQFEHIQGDDIFYEDEDKPALEIDDPRDRYAENEPLPQKSQTQGYRVLRFQWYEREAVYRAISADGRILEFNQQQYNKIKDRIEESDIQFVKQMKRVYYQAYVLGDQMLEKGLLPCQTGFTYKAMTGKRDRMQKYFYGLVAVMRDPQRWANKFFSSFMDLFASNAKGGVLAEEGAVDDMRKFEEEYAKSDSVIKVAQGALSGGKIQPKPQNPYPSVLDKIYTESINAIYRVAGVNLDMMGLDDSTQVGMVIESRKKSAYMVLAPFFDALSTYRKYSGIILLEYIAEYLPIQTIAQALEQELQPLAEQIKGIDLKQIRVQVAESPTSDHNRLVAWSFIQQVVPQLIQLGFPVPPDIMEYAPLPATLTAKWVKQIEEQQQQQAQQGQQTMEAQMEQLKLAMEQAVADIQKTYAQAEGAKAEALKDLADANKKRADSEEAQASADQKHIENVLLENKFGP